MGANDKVAATVHGRSPLDPIRARLEAATPGPWFLDAGGDSGVYTEARESRTSSDVASAFHREDEVLIANAPTDIRRLLNALDAALQTPTSGFSDPFAKGFNAAIGQVRANINQALGES